MKFIQEIIENSPILTLLLILFLVPLAVTNTYILQIMIFIGIYVILVSSLNLLNGYAGMIAIGHAGFYAIGAYASAMLMIDLNFPFVLAFIGGGLITGMFGYLIGKPTLKVEGIYLALATLGFNLVTWLVLLNWTSFTNGAMGIKSIPNPNIFGWNVDTKAEFYYFILMLVVVVIFSMNRLVNSRFGWALIAIREDQLAASAAGIDVEGYKIKIFVISAFYAGLAGGFYAHFITYIHPDSFTHLETFIILTMLALGGAGNMVGPIVGAALLVVVPELFREFSQYRMLSYGLVLIAVILLRPQGLFGAHKYNLRLNIFNKQEKKQYKGDNFLPPKTGE